MFFNGLVVSTCVLGCVDFVDLFDGSPRLIDEGWRIVVVVLVDDVVISSLLCSSGFGSHSIRSKGTLVEVIE